MTEISTLVTDYLLGALNVTLGLFLLRRAATNLSTRLWGWAFVASAVSAFAGGSWHGFQLLLPGITLFWLWKLVVYSIAAFAFAAVSGSVINSTSRSIRKGLLSGLTIAIVVYAVFMTTHDDFIYVIYLNAAAMSLVLGIHAVSAFSRRDPSSPWMIAGVLVSAIAAAVQASGLSPHALFNNNDLFHVVQMVGAYLLFRGAGLLGAQSQPSPNVARRQIINCP